MVIRDKHMRTINCLQYFILLCLTITFSACSSPKPNKSFSTDFVLSQSAQSQTTSTKEELKMLNEQSSKIIASVKKEQSRIDDLVFSHNDQLIIQVWLRDRTTQFKGYPYQQIIPPSGEIFFPDIGAVMVAGMTTAQLKALVTDHFTKTLKEPTVLVERIRKFDSVASSTAGWSQTADRQAAQLMPHIIVMGWVGEPGVYPLEPGLTVKEALALSGKLDIDGDYKRIYLVRGNIKNPEVARINLNRILRGQDLSKNYVLQPNDAIYVAPVKMWTAYDYIRTILMPISAVRDAVWVGSSAVTD